MKAGVQVARVVLGGLFVLAGVLKLVEAEAFAASVATFRVLPRAWSNVVALGLPVLEVLCGALLFAAGWRRAAALGLAVLSALFTVLLVQAIGRGLNVDCGCFGKWDPAAGHPVVALARDLVFLALAVYCYRNFPREGSAAESVQGAIAREMGRG